MECARAVQLGGGWQVSLWHAPTPADDCTAAWSAAADTTEVLQEEIMEFVNSIAKIVHMEVGFGGLVWGCGRGGVSLDTNFGGRAAS